MLLKTESFFILAKTEDWIYFQTGDRVSRTRNQQADLNLAFGVKNIFDQDYFIRSYDDNNKGIYAGQPRTLYMQGALKF